MQATQALKKVWPELIMIGATALALGLALFIPPVAFGLIGLIGVVTLAFLVYRCRLLSLHTFILLLPWSNLLLIALYGVIGLPANIVKLGLYWEESLVVLTFFITIYRLLTLRNWRIPVRLPLSASDGFALAQTGLSCIYIVVFLATSSNIAVVDLLRAIRDQMIYVVVYFIGRFMLLNNREGWGVIRSMVTITIIITLVGFIERFLVPIDAYLAIGAPQFFSDIVGFGYSSASLGLPENYWTSVGGITVRRAVSVYVSSQPFAINLTLLFPCCLWLSTLHWSMVPPGLLRPRLMVGVVLLAFAGLLLSITRANILLGVLEFVFALVLLRSSIWKIKRNMLYAMLCMLVGAMIVFVIFSGPIVRFVQNTINFTESSSRVHRDSLLTDWEYLVNHPFGKGISTAGITGARLSAGVSEDASGEGQYSKKIRETGLLGLLIYVGFLGSIIIHSYRLYRSAPAGSRSMIGLGFTICIAGISFMLNSVTTEWHGALSTSLVFWWLAGSCVTLAQQQATRSPVQV